MFNYRRSITSANTTTTAEDTKLLLHRYRAEDPSRPDHAYASFGAVMKSLSIQYHCIHVQMLTLFFEENSKRLDAGIGNMVVDSRSLHPAQFTSLLDIESINRPDSAVL